MEYIHNLSPLGRRLIATLSIVGLLITGGSFINTNNANAIIVPGDCKTLADSIARFKQALKNPNLDAATRKSIEEGLAAYQKKYDKLCSGGQPNSIENQGDLSTVTVLDF